MGFQAEDDPDIESVTGPVSLINKAKRSKGITLKRSSEKAITNPKSERQMKEDKRQALLKKNEFKMANLLSSDMTALNLK